MRTLTLADSIEAHVGQPIDVLRDPEPPAAESSNPRAPACQVSDAGVRIYVSDLGETDDYSFLHELLHIQRYAVESVPQLTALANPVDGPQMLSDEVLRSRQAIISDVENALEHLVIVPRMANYGWEPFGYWNENTRRIWAKYPWPKMTDRFTRRMTLFLNWLIRDLLTDDELVQRVKADMRAEGVFQEAENLRAAVRNRLADKKACTALVVGALGIPLGDVVLASVSFPGGNVTVEPLVM